jgi:hypothetical protein
MEWLKEISNNWLFMLVFKDTHRVLRAGFVEMAKKEIPGLQEYLNRSA